MNDERWQPSKSFLEWLDALPPTKKVMDRRAIEHKAERQRIAAERDAAIIAERQRILDAKKLAGDGRTKRVRQAKEQAMHPNSRIHLMEDDEEDNRYGKRKPAAEIEHPPVE